MLATTTWRSFQCPERPYAIPIDFIQGLISREFGSPNFDSIQETHSGDYDYDFDRRWIGRFKKRFTRKFIVEHLVFSAAEIMAAVLEPEKSTFVSKLLEIVYCHSSLDHDARDLWLAAEVTRLLGYQGGWENRDPNYDMVMSYVSGSGVCMHVASIGCAIARINGVRAEIMGHPKYIPGAPRGFTGQHYGIALYDSGDNRHLIIPRHEDKTWRGRRKKRQFVIMPEEPYIFQST
jgi:hypothetical protein